MPITDGNVAIAIVSLLFLVPVRNGGAKRILEVDAFGKLPWTIVLLFGGGFALAAGFQESGLSAWVGSKLKGLGELPLWLLVAMVCTVITLVSEVSSNTACAVIMMPVLGSMSVEIGIDPRILMLAGAMACSCGFVLPVATPPNAIVYATGRVPTREMARAGLFLDVAGVVLITITTLTVARFVFGYDFTTLPAWAHIAVK